MIIDITWHNMQIREYWTRYTIFRSGARTERELVPERGEERREEEE